MENIERITAAAKLDETIQKRLADLRAQEVELSDPVAMAEVGIDAALRTGDPALLLEAKDPRIARQEQLAEIREQIRKFEQARNDLRSDVAAYGYHLSLETVASSTGDKYRSAAKAVQDALHGATKALEAFIAERKALTAEAGIKHANAVTDLSHLRTTLESAIKDAARIGTNHARSA